MGWFRTYQGQIIHVNRLISMSQAGLSGDMLPRIKDRLEDVGRISFRRLKNSFEMVRTRMRSNFLHHSWMIVMKTRLLVDEVLPNQAYLAEILFR